MLRADLALLVAVDDVGDLSLEVLSHPSAGKSRKALAFWCPVCVYLLQYKHFIDIGHYKFQ